MLINIFADLTTANGHHIIALPQSQDEFDKTLTSMHIFTGSRDEYTIDKATSNLRGINYSICFAEDIEELNFLAQLLDGFYDNDLKTFEAIVIHEDGVLSMQSLINIAFRLFDYNIIRSIKSFRDLGAKYIKDKVPGSDIRVFNSIELSKVGIDVQAAQQGEFTSVGYISNYHLNIEEPYDGHLFPEYDYDENYILKLRLTTGDCTGNGVEFTIPASKNVVKRAMRRLGVNDLSECTITRYSSWNFKAITTSVWEDNDIEKLNSLVEKLMLLKRNDIAPYLTAVKNEDTITSIENLSLFTDFYMPNSFKKYNPKPFENSYDSNVKPLGRLRELLNPKVSR